MEQRISLITLGVSDLTRSRRFYEQGSGWKVSSSSNEQIVFFQVGSLALALYSRRRLPKMPILPMVATDLVG